MDATYDPWTDPHRETSIETRRTVALLCEVFELTYPPQDPTGAILPRGATIEITSMIGEGVGHNKLNPEVECHE
jgi:hypothetical protein